MRLRAAQANKSSEAWLLKVRREQVSPKMVFEAKHHRLSQRAGDDTHFLVSTRLDPPPQSD